MGKSNRVRAERVASATTKAPAKKTNNNKSSKSYSIAIILVAVFVLVTIIVTAVISSGILMRSAKAMKSEHYTITGTMFKYMVLSSYDDFLTNYQSYLSYFSLDTSKPLAEQTYGTGSEASLLGAFEGTWLDYFVDPVRTQSEQILIYCEEARDRGISLDDSDKTNIDEAIALIEADATKQGYTLDAYISLLYGKGMKVKDIRKTMELSTLAGKAAEAVDVDLVAGITADEVKAKYDANPLNYNVVDYVSYSVGVSFKNLATEVIDGYDGKSELTEEQKQTVLVKYKEKIAEAKEKVEYFSTIKDTKEFVDEVLKDVANDTFDDLYKTEALADADKLSAENLATVKEAMISGTISGVKHGDGASDVTTEANGTYSAYGVTLTANASKAIDSISTKLYSSVESAQELYGTQQQKYEESNEFAKWAFESGRDVGSIKIITEGDGSGDGEIKNESGYYSASIYVLEKPQYRDGTYSKDVAYMSFATKAAAEGAINAIREGAKPTLASFEAVAKEHGAVSNGVLENYRKGELSYNGFEEWLYDDTTLVGSYTHMPLPNATSNATEYAVFFYVENGDEAWYIDVKNDIFVDDYQAYYEALTEKYPITTNEKVIAKVEI